MNTLILSGVLFNLVAVCFARYPVNRRERERLRNNRLNLHRQHSNRQPSIWDNGFDPNLQHSNRQPSIRDRFRDNRFDPHLQHPTGQPIVNGGLLPHGDPHAVGPIVQDSVDISQVQEVGTSRGSPGIRRPGVSSVDRNAHKFGFSSLDNILPPSLIHQLRNTNAHIQKPTPVVKGPKSEPKPKTKVPIDNNSGRNTNDWQPPFVPDALDLTGSLGPLDGPPHGQTIAIGDVKPVDSSPKGNTGVGWNSNDNLLPIDSGNPLDRVNSGLGLPVEKGATHGQTVPRNHVKPVDKPKQGNTDIGGWNPNDGQLPGSPDQILWQPGGLDNQPILPELIPTEKVPLPGELNNHIIPEQIPPKQLPIPSGVNNKAGIPEQLPPDVLPPPDGLPPDFLDFLPPLDASTGASSLNIPAAVPASNTNSIPPPDPNAHPADPDLDAFDAFLRDFEGILDLPPPDTGSAGNQQPPGSNQQLDVGKIASLFEAHPESDPGSQAVRKASNTVKETQPQETQRLPGLRGVNQANQGAAPARNQAPQTAEERRLKQLEALAKQLEAIVTTTTAPTTTTKPGTTTMSKMDKIRWKRKMMRGFNFRKPS